MLSILSVEQKFYWFIHRVKYIEPNAITACLHLKVSIHTSTRHSKMYRNLTRKIPFEQHTYCRWKFIRWLHWCCFHLNSEKVQFDISACLRFTRLLNWMTFKWHPYSPEHTHTHISITSFAGAFKNIFLSYQGGSPLHQLNRTNKHPKKDSFETKGIKENQDVFGSPQIILQIKFCVPVS